MRRVGARARKAHNLADSSEASTNQIYFQENMNFKDASSLLHILSAEKLESFDVYVKSNPFDIKNSFYSLFISYDE